MCAGKFGNILGVIKARFIQANGRASESVFVQELLGRPSTAENREKKKMVQCPKCEQMRSQSKNTRQKQNTVVVCFTVTLSKLNLFPFIHFFPLLVYASFLLRRQ